MGHGPIWLVGMMGAGKSSVGPLLARSLKRRFVDADREIERAAGMTVPEIFELEGERGFRARERALVDALGRGGDVVALGGGALAQPGAAERLAATGTIVYLKASPEELLRRLGDGSNRPLLGGLDPAARRAKLERLLAERAGAYETAAIAVDTEGHTLEAVVEVIVQRLDGARAARAADVEKGARL